MKHAVLVIAFLALATPAARGQDSTAALLARARSLYEQLEVERALPLLRQILSPGWSHAVSAPQRTEAYTYLGALLVIVDRRDSAVAVFRALLDQDPFADLDVREFTPAQLAAFQRARLLVLSVGARPVPAMRLDPRVGDMVFTVVTTHPSDIRVEVRPAAAEGYAPAIVFAGELQGLRQIRWDGLMGRGRLAPPGRYALVVTGRSKRLQRDDSATVYFDVRQEYATLEDTLPPLGPRDLLPERHTRAAAGGDVLRGLGIGAAALFLARVIARDELRGDNTALVVAGLGIAVGGASYMTQRDRELPANVAINARRRAERESTNEAIRRRNADRLAQTVLLLAPAPGVSN